MRLIDADVMIDIIRKSNESHATNSREEVLLERNARLIEEQAKYHPVIIPVAELDTTEDFGEWIDRSDGGRIRYPFWERYECSKCGAKSENTNFCPNCGADMRVKDELNRVNKELNSEIEKSKSEIVPDYRDGWRLKDTHAEYWDNLGIAKEGDEK